LNVKSGSTSIQRSQNQYIDPKANQELLLDRGPTGSKHTLNFALQSCWQDPHVHVHGSVFNTGVTHVVKSLTAYCHRQGLSYLASSATQRAKKGENWQQLPIGPAPNMATFLPGPTPALLHACTAERKVCERAASQALQVVCLCLTSGTCSN